MGLVGGILCMVLLVALGWGLDRDIKSKRGVTTFFAIGGDIRGAIKLSFGVHKRRSGQNRQIFPGRERARLAKETDKAVVILEEKIKSQDKVVEKIYLDKKEGDG